MEEPHKSIISVNIIYKKNNNNIYDLEIIEIIDINKSDENNKLISDLNKQLKLSYELYNLCIDKIEYENDDKYKNIVDTLTKKYKHDLDLNIEKLNQQNMIDIEYITTDLNNTLSIEQTKRTCLESNLNEKITLESEKIKNEYIVEINNLKSQLQSYDRILQEIKCMNFIIQCQIR